MLDLPTKRCLALGHIQEASIIGGRVGRWLRLEQCYLLSWLTTRLNIWTNSPPTMLRKWSVKGFFTLLKS